MQNCKLLLLNIILCELSKINLVIIVEPFPNFCLIFITAPHQRNIRRHVS